MTPHASIPSGPAWRRGPSHDYAAKAGLGMCSIPWPRSQVLFVADPDATDESLEQVVSVAYCSALP